MALIGLVLTSSLFDGVLNAAPQQDSTPTLVQAPMVYRSVDIELDAPMDTILGAVQLSIRGFKDTLSLDLAWSSSAQKWQGKLTVPENGPPESWYVHLKSAQLGQKRDLGFFNVGSAIDTNLRVLKYQIPALQVPHLEVDTIFGVPSVKLGRQIWAVQNVQKDPIAGQSWCLENQGENCQKYGTLFQWSSALNLPAHCNSDSCQREIRAPQRGVCALGWHVPSKNEWEQLIIYAGGTEQAAYVLKGLDSLDSQWNDPTYHRGNPLSISLLPGGYRYSLGSFEDAGKAAYFWTSTEYDRKKSWFVDLRGDSKAMRVMDIDKDDAFAVRCIKD